MAARTEGVVVKPLMQLACIMMAGVMLHWDKAVALARLLTSLVPRYNVETCEWAAHVPPCLQPPAAIWCALWCPSRATS